MLFQLFLFPELSSFARGTRKTGGFTARAALRRENIFKPEKSGPNSYVSYHSYKWMAGRSSLNCEEGSFNGSRVSQLRANEGLLARKEVCGLKYYEGECAIPH